MFGKSQEIADLQAALTTAIGERDSLATAALTHEATVNALTAERDAAAAAAEQAAAARIAEVEAESKTKVEAEVINRLASAGVDPIERAPEQSNGDNTMKISEFKKLPAGEANAFIRGGGKLIN